MSQLATLLQSQLSNAPSARLPFAQVMQLALYHPEHGYYGPGPRRIGRQGDFYTSVSVGPLFGRLLAQRAVEVWRSLGEPADFAVIEQGAHDGQLAQDILNGLDELEQTFRYIIVEPNPRYQSVQHQHLGDRATWVESLVLLNTSPKHAFFVCNELPDAFPVHWLQWNGSTWEECYVEADGTGAFQFVPGPLSNAELETEVARLPRDLAPGHRVEVNLAMLGWIRELAAAAFEGSIFIADYGLDTEEFYAESRAEGTLRRYHQHQMDGRILEQLGECDLTTHIDFTRLIEEASALGLSQQEYDLQGRVLGRLATPWLRSLEGRPPDAATLRQFQSLTHPALMGRSFRCLILKKPACKAQT